MLSLRQICFVSLITCFLPVFGADQQQRGSLGKSPPVRLTRTEGGYRATLLLYSQRDMLSLQVEPQDGKADGGLTMSRRAELWKPLIAQAFSEHGKKASHLLAVAEYPELKARIATAAAKSGKWDYQTGKPRSGEAATALKDLLIHEKLFPELEKLFDSFGYRVSIHSVESVMLCRWKEIQSGEATLSGTGAPGPESLVPCGASILFRLIAKGEE